MNKDCIFLLIYFKFLIFMFGGFLCNFEGSNMVVFEGLLRVYIFYGCMVLGIVVIVLLVVF